MTCQVEECVLRAFALLQQDWAVDFLFNDNDSLFHLALQASEKVYGSFSVITDPTLPVISEHDLNESGSMLFVSALNRGLYTAGYEICHRKKSVQAVTLSDRYIAKTIRDDQNGDLFTVAYHAHLGVTEIAFCHPQTPGYRQQGVLMFRTDLFDNIINDVRKGNQLDFKALKHALVYSFLASEWRQCPNCESYNSQLCGCAVPSRLKLSANDFHHDRDSLELHSGAYNGMVDISIYAMPGAPPLIQRTVRSFSLIGLLDDEAERNSMCTWAMSKLMDKCGVDRFPSSVLLADDTQTVMDATQQLAEGASDASVCLNLEDPFSLFGESTTGGAGDGNGNGMTELYDLMSGCQRVGMEGGDVLVGGQASIDLSSMTTPLLLESCSGVGTDDTLSCITSGPASNEHAPVTEESQVLTDAATGAAAAQLAVYNFVNSASTRTSDKCVMTPHAAQTVGNADETPQTVSNASTGPVARRAVPIAPAGDATVDNRSAKLDANQLRLERRKARNRASAQRSNMKKKMALQNMKVELAELSSRQSRLRVEERKLREENLRLRAEVRSIER
eukprot:TRINITY_DN2279_c0_g1_i1.p1 TRINITY_DN2279_c0_g1~~TRINITY_DN2279_c0_g1_i1.p1  ORF type:complete len:561 (+),score=87.55 TRINITY_DN2279_c0_g1_i1:2665-4347(+)